MRTHGGSIYQLKVTLKDSKPPIWRRFLVREDTDLSCLHEILQDVMGWTGSHLYEFEVGGTLYTDLEDYDDYSIAPTMEAQSVTLRKLGLREGDKFRYVYDFGDYWVHDVVVEDVVPEQEGQSFPVCLKGRRACPPEDCGGIFGYFDLLTVINDPDHEDHVEMIEWLGDEFDPDAFDVEETNALLRSK